MLDRFVSPLRLGMIEDLTVTRFRAASQQDHVRHVKRFVSAANATAPTLLRSDHIYTL